ncbi:MAG: hypothetical protein AB7I42_19785 [Bradyrhizobium sp.]|uniref:hypothetical protein n=1 Tax=Bradyrhizobium sp. TaxID=376 RepID=UPI003D0E7E02
MLEWLIIAGIVILVAIVVLAFFDMADVVIDLLTSLFQLVVAAATLTIALLAALLNALKRLLNKQHNGIIP